MPFSFLSEGGMSKEEIRKNYRVNELLDQIYDQAWKTCDEADNVIKMVSDS